MLSQKREMLAVFEPLSTAKLHPRRTLTPVRVKEASLQSNNDVTRLLCVSCFCREPTVLQRRVIACTFTFLPTSTAY